MDNTLKQLVDELLTLRITVNHLQKENQELKEVNRQQAENLKEEKPTVRENQTVQREEK